MAQYAGQKSANGKNSFTRESKFGLWVTMAVGAGLSILADMLGSLDVSPLPDWLEGTAGFAIAAGVGAIVAYRTKNRL